MEDNTNIQRAFELVKSEYDHLSGVFLLDDMFYATDTFIAIRASVEDCDFTEYGEWEKDVKIKELFGEPSEAVVLPIRLSDLQKYKTEDDYDWTGEDIICEDCLGDGEVEWEYRGRKDNFEKYFECPVCKGVGLSSEHKKVKNGKKTFPDNAYVRVRDAYFRMSLFERVLMIKELMESNIVLTSYINDIRPISLRIGKCELIVAPTHFYSDQSIGAIIVEAL